MNDHSKKVDCVSETFLSIQIVRDCKDLESWRKGGDGCLSYRCEMKGWCCMWNSSFCICVFSCGKALRLHVSTTLPVHPLVKNSVCLKSTSSSLMLQRGTRIWGSSLLNVIGWMVFSSSTHSLLEETCLRCEWDDNHTSPAPVLETMRSFNVEPAWSQETNKML